MSKNFSFLSFFSLLLSIGSLYADDRELSPRDAYDTVRHRLIDSVQFNRKEVSFREEKQGCLVDPHESTGDVRQCILRYTDAPQILSREHLIIKGEDRRERILNTTEWPYRAHGSLTLHFDNMTCGGSGVLVGPRHVLTCGHNVYWPERRTNAWAKRILFYPALNDVSAYDVSDVVDIYTFKAWTECAHTDFELALLVLAKPLGITIGYYGLACFDDAMLKRETVDVTGYPGKKGNGQMWAMSGRLKTIGPEKITYDLDTSEGQSGGAISVFKGGNPYVVGIHTHGQSTGNIGVRLSLDKWKKIVEWIAETGELSTPIESALAEFHARFSDQNSGIDALEGGPIIDEQRCLRAVLITDRGREIQKGALAGNPNLQMQFGKALLSCWHGAPVDNQMSMHWLRLAASQGDVEARRVLRDLALTWPDVAITSLPTFDEMSSLLTVRQTDGGERFYQLSTAGKAAEQVLLAKQLLENWGAAPQEHRLVIYLLRLAACQENPEAIKMLERMGVPVEATERVNFPTLEEIDALIQVLKSHRDGNTLYEVAMEGNPYVQTCLGKHLLKHRKGIPQDNRLAIYLLRLAAHRYYGDCAREVLKNMGLPNPRLWTDSHPTLEEVQGMMQVIEAEGGMTLYQAATENEKPLRLHKRANGAEREACDLERIGDPLAQQELGQRLLNNWFRMLDRRIEQGQRGSTSVDAPTLRLGIELAVDGFMDSQSIEDFDLWNVDMLLYASRYTNLKWTGNHENAEVLRDHLYRKIDEIKTERAALPVNRENLYDQRVIYFPSDNWFTMYWLRRASMSNPEIENMVLALTYDDMFYMGFVGDFPNTVSAETISHSLTLADMRCFLSATQTEEDLLLYYSAVSKNEVAQSRFGQALLRCWEGEPQDNRLAISWLQSAAKGHDPDAQKILKRMNLHWSGRVLQEEEIAYHTLGINLRKCEMMS